MKNQKSVFQFGKEYQCTDSEDVVLNQLKVTSVDVTLDGEHLGKIIGVSIPDIDSEDENIQFDKEVIQWIAGNDFVFGV